MYIYYLLYVADMNTEISMCSSTVLTYKDTKRDGSPGRPFRVAIEAGLKSYNNIHEYDKVTDL